MGHGKRCARSGLDPNSACTAELARIAARSLRRLGGASAGLGDASAMRWARPVLLWQLLFVLLLLVFLLVWPAVAGVLLVAVAAVAAVVRVLL
eukprot:144452-Pyramimonas_sp.AAC.1